VVEFPVFVHPEVVIAKNCSWDQCCIKQEAERKDAANEEAS
jgi:hypothetical protein